MSDILFENTSGTYDIWELNRTAIIGGGPIGQAPAGDTFAGVADLDGDGKSDIVFVNAADTYSDWTLNGTTITGGGIIGTPGSGFTLLDPGGDVGTPAPVRAALMVQAMAALPVAFQVAASAPTQAINPTARLLATSHL
jgi:hypothetical protein